ncbi:MAG TPA: DUF58 domain-containing protein [Longimicrobiales bacterium]|nr:DUF58 domain-containing protein [Longimicrobiales bacterium]
MSVLSPDVVAGIEDLELAARVVVEGLRAGSHRSPYHGYSAEFQQHRPYRPGDDLKYLDWKVLGRSDRLYSRQFRETTSMSVLLLPDTSASMGFPETGVTKFRYASVLAAALAYLVTTRGDAVGMLTQGTRRAEYVPARSGRPHLQALLAALDRLRPQGSWDGPRMIALAAERLRKPGVLIVLSDFYDDEEATATALRRAARAGHDVAMLQMTSADERSLSHSGHLEFVDAESGGRRVVDATGAAPAYAAAVAAFHERCRTQAHRDGIDYALVATEDPPAQALRQYLLLRSAAAPGARR